MQIYEELERRGLIAQVTNEEEIKDLINRGKAIFYIGFDPTADSLHVGHFMTLCLMRRLQLAGNKPIVLLGDGTSLVGDPSGRTDMRAILDEKQIAHNSARFKEQISRFIDFSEGKALCLNNGAWLKELKYVELLRDVGACFSVNRMLAAECYKQRMEKGLTFLEFNYMVMQAYDFYHLFSHYGCNMQFGGDDQWSNMLAGTELIRKKTGKDSYALTIPLLTTAEGQKMGKSVKGALWLDKEKTSPYDFYQYWRNVDDADIDKCLKMLTFLPLETIEEMGRWPHKRINEKKEILAFEITKLVHGEEEANHAQSAARALFTGEGDDSNMPTTELELDDDIGLLDLLVLTKLASSKSEARRLIEQGGILINDEKINDVTLRINRADLKEPIKIKKGKKSFHKVTLKD
ncbi:MAG TPA: tyrosine--tRNA ligase [Erysipelotrichaceae bacterium]|nr:tyrosine--tRNA ligase [Erysipelotrichaceae bacterium]